MTSILKPAAAWPFPATRQPEALATQATESQNEFVTIPATTLPTGQHVPEFQVGKYLASRNAAGDLVVTADGLPVTRINYFDAAEACKAAGLSLLTLSQSQAIAINIASVAANWSGGAVGEGSLKQGLRAWSVSGAQAGTYSHSDASQSREFLLSNGETIFDAAGHLYTWLFDDVQGDERGVVASAFAADSPAVTGAPFPSMENGMGWYPDAGDDWSGYALIRGGYFHSGGVAGVFRLGGVFPDDRDGVVGFRCTK